MKKKLSAVLLAAGTSSRMGKANKLLLPLKSKAMLCHCVEQLQQSKIEEIIVVTGHEEALIRSVLQDYNAAITIVHNPNFRQGMTSSIQKGIAACAKTTQGFMICLGDMPFLKTLDYNRLIDAFKGANQIIAPYFGQRRGNPILFGANYKTALLNHTQPNGCKEILKTNSKQVVPVQFDQEQTFQDIDFPNDYHYYNSIPA